MYNNEGATSKVVFGEPGDTNLLGVTTLENLGYVLDPIQRRLLQLPMLLATIKPIDSGSDLDSPPK